MCLNAASPKRTVIVDAGLLKAAMDGGDADQRQTVQSCIDIQKII